MTKRMTERTLSCATLACMAFAAWPGSPAMGQESGATQPATRPAGSPVLVRFEHTNQAITQAEFDSYFFNGPAVSFDQKKDDLMRELVERKMLLIYMDDHPDLVPERELRAEQEKFRQKNNLTSEADFQAYLKRTRLSPESYEIRWLVLLGRKALYAKGEERANSEARLKAAFEANPDHYNGTEVTARHILKMVVPYDTPAQKKAKREQLETIRQDLLAGRRTWAEAVKESEYPDRRNGGNLGFFTRHWLIQEPLAAAAFALEVDKLSEVVESSLGFHILEVTSRRPGTKTFEEVKDKVAQWLRTEPFVEAIRETRQKHPPIGVRPPDRPTPPGSVPSATQPAGTPQVTAQPS